MKALQMYAIFRTLIGCLTFLPCPLAARTLQDRTRVQERLGGDARPEGQLDDVPEGASDLHGAWRLPLLLRLRPESHLSAEGADALRGLLDGRVSPSRVLCKICHNDSSESAVIVCEKK